MTAFGSTLVARTESVFVSLIDPTGNSSVSFHDIVLVCRVAASHFQRFRSAGTWNLTVSLPNSSSYSFPIPFVDSQRKQFHCESDGIFNPKRANQPGLCIRSLKRLQRGSLLDFQFRKWNCLSSNSYFLWKRANRVESWKRAQGCRLSLCHRLPPNLFRSGMISITPTGSGEHFPTKRFQET